jgi:hypothetical protein
VMLLELIRAIHAERAQYMDRGIYVTVILEPGQRREHRHVTQQRALYVEKGNRVLLLKLAYRHATEFTHLSDCCDLRVFGLVGLLRLLGAHTLSIVLQRQGPGRP